MNLMDVIWKRAKGLKKRIIFPEGEDERIIAAADVARNDGIILPILVGDERKIRDAIKKLRARADHFDIIDPSRSDKLEQYAALYSKISGIPKRTAVQIVRQPIFYAALALKSGDADGMVGGIVYTSGDFVSVCKGVIGLKKGVKVPSSFFIMEIPGYSGGENGVIVYADASVNPNPTSDKLADIAITTGNSAKTLLGWDPRIAILSFSTKGSASHPDVCKVIRATEIARKKAKGMRGFAIDGELQADTALVLSTAQRKIKGNLGDVAGKANILIFPDLDAGNISYKLTQILAKANAYGPILQGFDKPLSDLSRGATVKDVSGAIAIVAIMAKGWKR